uniref:Uncharacterized protein n=1 Tax=Tanacetum cinerariifolium TaxID=118510 RepID=A0A6L2L124_TANCI|nr:hypothetical protein [Tanacetum cinerariifolium]
MPFKSPDTKSNHPHHQVRSCGSRRFLAAASYDSNVWPHNLGNVGGGVVLDFESSDVRLPSAEEESGDVVAGAGRRKRDCNVEPMASGDRVPVVCRLCFPKEKENYPHSATYKCWFTGPVTYKLYRP